MSAAVEREAEARGFYTWADSKSALAWQDYRCEPPANRKQEHVSSCQEPPHGSFLAPSGDVIRCLVPSRVVSNGGNFNQPSKVVATLCSDGCPPNRHSPLAFYEMVASLALYSATVAHTCYQQLIRILNSPYPKRKLELCVS
jgi:hypothetical protein